MKQHLFLHKKRGLRFFPYRSPLSSAFVYCAWPHRLETADVLPACSRKIFYLFIIFRLDDGNHILTDGIEIIQILFALRYDDTAEQENTDDVRDYHQTV